uniref:Uncharacterized protein n=1 Tax=Rhizophora mucronata TaxID=61149 RepID=A0A2P2NBY9_RHIMU
MVILNYMNVNRCYIDGE